MAAEQMHADTHILGRSLGMDSHSIPHGIPIGTCVVDTIEIRMGNATHPNGTPMGLPMGYDLKEFIKLP